jgi:catechol 2,3-dioxygenase-like lactoylglutathione lyase family enzyme
MKLNQIHQSALCARDLDEAISFYRDTLGAQLLAKFEPPGLAFFEFSGVRLLLEKSASRSTVCFRVSDIDSSFSELQSKGVPFLDKPHLVHKDEAGAFGQPGKEEWMAFFSNPSGNVLALASRK